MMLRSFLAEEGAVRYQQYLTSSSVVSNLCFQQITNTFNPSHRGVRTSWSFHHPPPTSIAAV